MSKAQKGISLIILVLIVAAIIAISAVIIVLVLGNGAKDEQSNGDLNNNIVDNEEKKELTNEKVMDLWIKTVKFPETTNAFNLTLFDGLVKVPINLEQFENSDYVFNYHVDSKEYNVKKLKDMTQKNKSTDYIYIQDSNEKTIMIITLLEVTDDSLTHYQRIQKGLWTVSLYENDLMNTLGIENDDEKEKAFLGKLVETLGRPTHIYEFQNTFTNDNVTDDSRSVVYHMMYEYDKYAIEFCVQEMIFDNKRHHIKISYITYHNNIEEYKKHVEGFESKESKDILSLLNNK